ncbi:MAG: conjugal transfer protein TraL [Deltaproteobacteria bacterium]|nr:conjugal transfer protein TraL [Deltaproteobacteria bacterium]
MLKRFPKYLSSPYQVLWFETDDMGIIALFSTLAMMIGGWFWLLLFAGPYGYGRLKRKYPRGFLKHCFYFSGVVTLKGYPIFFEKTFQE